MAAMTGAQEDAAAAQRGRLALVDYDAAGGALSLDDALPDELAGDPDDDDDDPDGGLR